MEYKNHVFNTSESQSCLCQEMFQQTNLGLSQYHKKKKNKHDKKHSSSYGLKFKIYLSHI